jgi:hypothetical protein
MNVADQIKAAVTRLEATGEPFDVLESADWIAAVEDKLGRRLPNSFRCLVTGFAFPEFDIGGVTIFSNLNDGSLMDITVAPFADRFMSPWLLSRGYVQFGKPDTGNYDPVCFDYSEGQREPPIVVLDHEDILLEHKRVRIRKLADSFLDLLEKGLHNKALQGDARNART